MITTQTHDESVQELPRVLPPRPLPAGHRSSRRRARAWTPRRSPSSTRPTTAASRARRTSGSSSSATATSRTAATTTTARRSSATCARSSIAEIAASPFLDTIEEGFRDARLLEAPPLRRVLQEPGGEAAADRPDLALRAALPVEGPVPAVPERAGRGELAARSVPAIRDLVPRPQLSRIPFRKHPIGRLDACLGGDMQTFFRSTARSDQRGRCGCDRPRAPPARAAEHDIGSPTAAPGEPGKARLTTLDVAGMDTGSQACTDFYQYANGGWLVVEPDPVGPAALGHVRRAVPAQPERPARRSSRSSPRTGPPPRAPTSASSATSTPRAWTRRRSRRRDSRRSSRSSPGSTRSATVAGLRAEISRLQSHGRQRRSSRSDRRRTARTPRR